MNNGGCNRFCSHGRSVRRKNRAAYSDSVIDADSSIALNLDYLTLLEITIEERTVPKRGESALLNIVGMKGERRCGGAGVTSAKTRILRRARLEIPKN